MSRGVEWAGGGRPGGNGPPRVVTLTLNPAVDLCWEMGHLSAVGKNRARVRARTAGGGGINVARGVTRLGGLATAVHTAGRETGELLDRLLDEEGIDHVSVPIEGETREGLVLYETDMRRCFHVVPRGPRTEADEGLRCLAALRRAVGDSSYVVASGSLPPGLPADFYATVARQVSESGARLILDTSGHALRGALAEGVHLLRCNQHEAASLAGRPVRTFHDARLLNARLLDTGAAHVVVTALGPLGALCSTGTEHTEVHAPPLPGDLLSDAGAGDSMVAALALRLAAGDDVATACTLAVAVAAASVLTAGTDPFDPAVAASILPDVTTRPEGSERRTAS
ncbi:1-phosphofructokinase family hexose kinase [Streptomyces sp. NPDC021224]|uniref:1-phosphofructokinase family hexose kinase n=1 Tax=unclassified Streptomyces TaxID=2593676 RepID=UPI00378A8DE5